MAIENALAIFYVAAQVIERTTEALKKGTGIFDDTKAEIEASEATIASLKKKIESGEEGQEAKLKTELEGRNKADNKMVLLIFLFTSFLGILMAISGIRFLEMFDASVDPTIDIILTGLVLGGGTKPLHDLIKYIEKKKE